MKEKKKKKKEREKNEKKKIEKARIGTDLACTEGKGQIHRHLR